MDKENVKRVVKNVLKYSAGLVVVASLSVTYLVLALVAVILFIIAITTRELIIRTNIEEKLNKAIYFFFCKAKSIWYPVK